MSLKNKKMSKGVTIGLPTVLYLVLVILVVVFAFLALTYASDIIQYILGLLGVESNELTEAIKCAYYRCTEGCAVAEGIVDSDVFDCSPFCSAVPAEFRPDNKICNENAKLYPVELDTTEDMEISKSMLSDTFDCITDRGVGSGWDIIGHCSQFWTGRLLGVDESYVDSYGEKGSCLPCSLGTDVPGPYPDYESVTLSPNSYKIVGVRDSGGVWPINWDYKKVEIYTEEELSEMTCQNYGSSTCVANGCKWCSLCDDGKMNKFGKDICILPTGDCGYSEHSSCGATFANLVIIDCPQSDFCPDSFDNLKNPNEICHIAFGDGWYASSVDCETIEDSIGNRNFDDPIDWCHDNSGGDLTVTCVKSLQDYRLHVIDCGGDCRNSDKSPDSYCGSGWYASSVDCELINIKNIGDGDHTRYFDWVWSSDNSNGWCEDTSDEDMTVTCIENPPEYKIEVRECDGDCENEGTLPEICGLGWQPVAVDCEAVHIDGLDRDYRTATIEEKAYWCRDTGGEDMTVTCVSKAGDCDDPDGGVDYLVKGICTDGGDCADGCDDYCDGDAIVEYICSGGSCMIQLPAPLCSVVEPAHPTCADGACVGTVGYLPPDRDAWTESLTPADGSWSDAAGEVSLDTTQKVKGSGSIKTYGINLYWIGSVFTLNSGKEVNANLYTILSFWIQRDDAWNGNMYAILYDTADKSASHYFYIGENEWFQKEFRVGEENADVWDVESGFDWTNIKEIRFDCWASGVGTGYFWVDGLWLYASG